MSYSTVSCCFLLLVHSIYYRLKYTTLHIRVCVFYYSAYIHIVLCVPITCVHVWLYICCTEVMWILFRFLRGYSFGAHVSYSTISHCSLQLVHLYICTCCMPLFTVSSWVILTIYVYLYTVPVHVFVWNSLFLSVWFVDMFVRAFLTTVSSLII
jgi:hypothetical protein